MNTCIFTILSCIVLWLSHTTPALGWGAVAHAVIGQLAEDELLANNAALRTLLTRFRDPRSISTCTRRCSAWTCRAQGTPYAPWQTGQTGTSGSRACYPLMSNAIISICPSPPVIIEPNIARMAYAPLKPSWPNVLYWLIAALRCRNGRWPWPGWPISLVICISHYTRGNWKTVGAISPVSRGWGNHHSVSAATARSHVVARTCTPCGTANCWKPPRALCTPTMLRSWPSNSVRSSGGCRRGTASNSTDIGRVAGRRRTLAQRGAGADYPGAYVSVG